MDVRDNKTISGVRFYIEDGDFVSEQKIYDQYLIEYIDGEAYVEKDIYLPEISEKTWKMIVSPIYWFLYPDFLTHEIYRFYLPYKDTEK